MTWQVRRFSLLPLRYSNPIRRQVVEFVHQFVNLPVGSRDLPLELILLRLGPGRGFGRVVPCRTALDIA
jgi:hypothetical protein